MLSHYTCERHDSIPFSSSTFSDWLCDLHKYEYANAMVYHCFVLDGDKRWGRNTGIGYRRQEQ
jgi:hypothetical protein